MPLHATEGLLAGNHAKFVDSPPKPIRSEHQKHFLVYMIDVLFADPVPARSVERSVRLWREDRQHVTVKAALNEPASFELCVAYMKSVQLTKTLLLKRIAMAESWSTTEAVIRPQGLLPAAFTSLVEDFMKQETVATIITFITGAVSEDTSEDTSKSSLEDGGCQIGCTLVDGTRRHYAVASELFCVLDGPLQVNWLAPCAIMQVELINYSGYTEDGRPRSLHRRNRFYMNDPADGRSECSSSKMKALQTAAVESVDSFFWNQYPVSDCVAELRPAD